MTDTQEDAGFAEPGPSAARNTDRHLWPMTSDREDADSIHVTADGGIGINVGGHVIVMTLRKWFCAALACNQDSIPSTFEELTALRSQNKVMREALEFYSNSDSWNEDGQCPAGRIEAPMWSGIDGNFIDGHLDLGETARAALIHAKTVPDLPNDR